MPRVTFDLKGIKRKGLVITWLSTYSFWIENTLVSSKIPAGYIYILYIRNLSI